MLQIHSRWISFEHITRYVLRRHEISCVFEVNCWALKLMVGVVEEEEDALR